MADYLHDEKVFRGLHDFIQSLFSILISSDSEVTTFILPKTDAAGSAVGRVEKLTDALKAPRDRLLQFGDNNKVGQGRLDAILSLKSLATNPMFGKVKNRLMYESLDIAEILLEIAKNHMGVEVGVNVERALFDRFLTEILSQDEDEAVPWDGTTRCYAQMMLAGIPYKAEGKRLALGTKLKGLNTVTDRLFTYAEIHLPRLVEVDKLIWEPDLTRGRRL
ncbi:hypothetical protein BJ508DRAFT_73236 [Ascobolus immersus RN42]|uniref:Uncharacterized protein n=1 Tax=Ascobolus immersus RN42 TaxID=1160509 RepID=A0A3N4HK00_ASCIM|nr:hypothetical protein BJ508DRAFT_73236 [Ascobolus immersus RN42]